MRLDGWLRFEGHCLRCIQRYKEGGAALIMEGQENTVVLYVSQETLESLEAVIRGPRTIELLDIPGFIRDGQITANNLVLRMADKSPCLEFDKDGQGRNRTITLIFRPSKNEDPEFSLMLDWNQIVEVHRRLNNLIH